MENKINYGDWYLPSLEELTLMYINREAINNMALVNGGAVFQSDFYWSSTEIDEDIVWSFDFNLGVANSLAKLNDALVRAVRAF